MPWPTRTPASLPPGSNKQGCCWCCCCDCRGRLRGCCSRCKKTNERVHGHVSTQIPEISKCGLRNPTFIPKSPISSVIYRISLSIRHGGGFRHRRQRFKMQFTDAVVGRHGYSSNVKHAGGTVTNTRRTGHSECRKVSVSNGMSSRGPHADLHANVQQTR